MSKSKNFLSLGIFVAINLGLQFLFQWYIITFLGVNTQTDALFGAMALPQFILLVLSGSLTIVLIPIIAQYAQDEFLVEAWNYFQVIGLLFTAIALLLWGTAHWWVGLLLPGFKGADFKLTLLLTKIQLIAMVFSAMLSVVWAIHSAKENFFKIEYTSIVANLIMFVLLYFLIKPFGIYAVAWISVGRVLLQVLFLMPIMGPYRKPNFNSPSFKLIGKKLTPLVAGNAYYKTDALVDRYLTSSGTAGELTLLNLAQQIYLTINSILVKVLVNTMVPEMAVAHSKGDESRFNHILKKRLLLSFACTALSFFGMLFLGQWALGLVFAFKKFTVQDVLKLWWLLLLLIGYLVGGLLGSITSSSFYAKGDTATPTKIGAILFTLYLPIKIYCYFKFGIIGLAISISAYFTVSLLAQLYFLRPHFKA